MIPILSLYQIQVSDTSLHQTLWLELLEKLFNEIMKLQIPFSLSEKTKTLTELQIFVNWAQVEPFLPNLTLPCMLKCNENNCLIIYFMVRSTVWTATQWTNIYSSVVFPSSLHRVISANNYITQQIPSCM